jgi:hypothetical protein
MTTIVEPKKTVASTKLINAKLISTIPSTSADHCIYNYGTKVDSHFDIKDPKFFHPLYTFIRVGDMLRIFRYEKEELICYYEFICTAVDKIEKTVQMVSIVEKNVQKAGK